MKGSFGTLGVEIRYVWGHWRYPRCSSGLGEQIYKRKLINVQENVIIYILSEF